MFKQTILLLTFCQIINFNAFSQECPIPLEQTLSADDAQKIAVFLSSFLDAQSNEYSSASLYIDSSNMEYDLRINPSVFTMPIPGESNKIDASVYMSQGYLEKQNAMTLALALTHEFGHLIGQGPTEEYFVAGQFVYLASEGEADYLSADLLRRAYDFKPSKFSFILNHNSNKSMTSTCVDKIKSLSNAADEITHSILSHGASLMNLTAHVTGEKPPVLDSFDKTIVDKTLLDYPSIQSRWDSLRAGILGTDRPRSWALPADFK